ncbi:MAG: hypothetical protein WCJ30_06460, partial [Deltaproteobacteria bacterium]
MGSRKNALGSPPDTAGQADLRRERDDGAGAGMSAIETHERPVVDDGHAVVTPASVPVAQEVSKRSASLAPPRRSIAPRHRESHDPLDRSTDTQLGTSDRARSANEALRALARAARSYTIYDANNAAVRNFIEEMLEAIEGFCAAHGSLVVEVRPQELVLDGEPVYRERDRERSLAGRLFKDGVRELSIEVGVDWRELVALLEVLSVRFVGIRQTEDDLVTLVEKAGLKYVRVRAVDGVVLLDEDHDDDDGGEIRLPTAFDLPAPWLVPRVQPRYAPVTEEELETLRAELAPESMTPQAVGLVRAVLARWTAVNTTGERDLLTAVGDVREYLLTEGDIESIASMDQFLSMHAARHPEQGHWIT